MGWSFQDKHKLHDKLGPLFTLVTPAGNEVTVADPQAAHAVLARRKDYIKPAIMYEQLNVFGRNLNTVNGEEWQRHRRLTAPSFNEKISSLVWDEAGRQAHDMISSWTQQGERGTKDTVADTATLALHVLTNAAFGAAYPFSEGVTKVSPGHEMTYRDSLSLCLSNIITFAILPKKSLSLSFMPRKLQRVGQAAREFQQYMAEMLASDRASTKYERTNLMSALVRASDEDADSKAGGQDSSKLGLTDDEIFGNIFAYNLAGHETTANTVAFALCLLAAYPKYQEWVREEIRHVTASDEGKGEQSYEQIFPRLQRCLAVMYETLRLYGSVVFIPRATASSSPQTISLPNPNNKKTETRDVIIPPSTAVNINVQALHTDPQLWGPDALEWRPTRWLQKSSPHDKESFISTVEGQFIPWADGPRVCPGQKFAQVEFVRVMFAALGGYRVVPVPVVGQGDGGRDGEGEGEERARGEVRAMVEDSGIQAITLQMREPGRVRLKWVAL
ncbi:MAG: hypothetical protein LQ350_002809 [Teloschistes chrysophthalmus]|nr:MAG: hypothetical protein LQ350_002809 [Niorma chrysophthalma]